MQHHQPVGIAAATRRIIGFGLLISSVCHGSLCVAQSTSVENLGVASAKQVSQGLGFNLDPTSDTEFRLASAAGATTVRFQCGWEAVETQTAPPKNTNLSPQFLLPASCQSGLDLSKKYSMHPTVIAAYGSPFHKILQLSIPNGAAAGSKSIDVAYASGVGGDTLANIAYPYDTIIDSSGVQITKLHSYAGGLITGITMTGAGHATLTLASALVSALPADPAHLYSINEYLYPPAGSSLPNDPSVQAYAHYAEFLAASIAREGISGEVEIWNEPPWPDDPWDDRWDFYDEYPGAPTPATEPFMPNFGFAAALQDQVSPVAGVTYVWGGTHKSGASSLLNWMKDRTGEGLVQPSQVVTTEAMHPYGNTPEDELWSESCLEGTILPYPQGPTPFYPCNLFGLAGGNASVAEQFNLVQKSRSSNWGIHREITETGFPGSAGDDAHKARFVLRQFLGFQAQGVSPIEFYRLYDPSASNWGFVSQTAAGTGAYAPLPAYTAISGLMSDFASISVASDPATSGTSPVAVTSYAGTYPLTITQFVGARSISEKNSTLVALWQRSNGDNWGTLPSPIPAPVTLSLPSGLSVSVVLNMTTRAAVPYVVVGRSVSFLVSDDPVEVMLFPAPKDTIPVSISVSYLDAGFSAKNTATQSSGNEVRTIRASNAARSVQVPFVQATPENVEASQSRLDSSMGMTNRDDGLVALQTIKPSLKFDSISKQAIGGPAFAVRASSESSGTVTYKVISGPAKLVGRDEILLTGAGLVSIQAAQEAAANFAPAEASIEFRAMAQ